jgi:hypothetical protein
LYESVADGRFCCVNLVLVLASVVKLFLSIVVGGVALLQIVKIVTVFLTLKPMSQFHLHAIRSSQTTEP